MSSNLTSNDVQEENIENDNEFATEEIEDDCDNQVAEADLVPAEPKKGMIFYTIGDAFTFYKRDAKRKGFSTDKKNLLN